MLAHHSNHGPYTIHVTGDPTIDWMLVVPEVIAPAALQVSYQWDARVPVQIVSQPGGAALLSMLLDAASNPACTDQVVVTGPVILENATRDPANNAVTRTYTVWQPYPASVRGGALVWRMQQFLGAHRALEGVTPAAEPTPAPDCLVIDDANFGFREHPAVWPLHFGDGYAPRHVILKMSNPLASGPLWERLLADHGNVLTVYCSVGDLRKEYAPVGQPLSWERTGSDITHAVRARPDLSAAARVIVSVGMSGAVLVERNGPATLIFDPLHQEGDWERGKPGTPVGLGTCITAALAIATARDPATPDWSTAIATGLDAGRALHDLRRIQPDAPNGSPPWFPIHAVAECMTQTRETCFRAVAIPAAADWHVFDAVTDESYRAIAARIVVEGDMLACRDLPIERIGAWSSIDRTEIESMRSVRNIIREYITQSRRTRPLSLAVFGPPGAGKSFAIKQMAREWMAGGANISVLEFNLSQLGVISDLPHALQRVRDCAVEGTLPLVFWDEFDTALGGRELGWLAAFLAPMQDGTFLEHGVTRPIGPSIFVFAGGTHATMTSFKARAVDVPGAKATDFLSRLRGFVDILDPNAMHPDDDTFILRRALLLRALLQAKAPALLHGDRLDIDPGVLRAFLDVQTYVHGARSIESIIDMSALSGKLRYERSALPPHHQLNLHVAAEEFLTLVHGTP